MKSMNMRMSPSRASETLSGSLPESLSKALDDVFEPSASGRRGTIPDELEDAREDEDLPRAADVRVGSDGAGSWAERGSSQEPTEGRCSHRGGACSWGSRRAGSRPTPPRFGTLGLNSGAIGFKTKLMPASGGSSGRWSELHRGVRCRAKDVGAGKRSARQRRRRSSSGVARVGVVVRVGVVTPAKVLGRSLICISSSSSLLNIMPIDARSHLGRSAGAAAIRAKVRDARNAMLTIAV
mmetsp:Transcript_71117/g.201555  ORF Transcript_71117/g.201555 Transcript_71117/m.201555 type:complete len:238 (+) Transcript_71117:712-1425(+)